MLPGLFHSGVCYLQTPDNRKGWAKLLSESGYRVLVSDLPGTGRSGYIPQDKIDGEFLINGYKDLIEELESEEIILFTHSLTGPHGFKLAEILPRNIRALVSVEPGLIGNIQEPIEPIEETEKYVKAEAKGFTFELDFETRLFTADQRFVDRLTKDYTKNFPKDQKSIDQYTSSMQSGSSRLMYERLNINNSQVSINDFSKLEQVRLLIVTGSEDPVHIDTDQQITKYLRKQEVEVDHFHLEEQGITGNGHMMMLEKNNKEVLDFIRGWL